MYRVCIEQFEGPLDLLLEIIEAKKLSLIEIRLSQVAEQFIAHLEEVGEREPREIVEFLSIASRLALMKARELVPDFGDDDEAEGSIEELRKTLSRYQPFRHAARLLSRHLKEQRRLYAREAFASIRPVFHFPQELTGTHLGEAMEGLLAEALLPRRIPQASLVRRVSLEECISALREIVRGRGRVDFFAFIAHESRETKVVHFLGILEMTRMGTLIAHQSDSFSPIMLTLHE